MKDQAPELLPCPFCQTSPVFTCAEQKDERRYVEMRLTCGAGWCDVEMSASLSFSQYKSMTPKQIDAALKTELTKRWNTRPPSERPEDYDDMPNAYIEASRKPNVECPVAQVVWRDQIIEECAKAAESAAWEGDIDSVLIAIRSLSHKKD